MKKLEDQIAFMTKMSSNDAASTSKQICSNSTRGAKEKLTAVFSDWISDEKEIINSFKNYDEEDLLRVLVKKLLDNYGLD